MVHIQMCNRLIHLVNNATQIPHCRTPVHLLRKRQKKLVKICHPCHLTYDRDMTSCLLLFTG